MFTFDELNLNSGDIAIVLVIGIIIYIITVILYKPLIKWLHSKDWVGYDIHKTARPATAESGGIGLTIGILIGILAVGLFFPELWDEILVFLVTIVLSATIGFYDDRKQLPSLLKILLMVLTGVPLFLMNYFGYINVDSPTLPVLGGVRLTIIYPLVLPFIITILTNTVNMLEGYNGEGSGTTSIAVFFIIIAAIIAQSSEALIFGIPVLAAILAFYKFNKFPAKVFPGDVGTLVIGAAIGLLGILGSLEVVMALTMLTHIFNSFYVLASIRGWITMKDIKHDVKIPDIFVDKSDLIHASAEAGAPLTLPRLILASGPLKEDELVKHFMALAIISGIFATFSEIIRQWTIPTGLHSERFTIVMIIVLITLFIIVIFKFPRIFGISVIMILLSLIGLLLFWIIDQFVVTNPLNWLYSFGLAGAALLLWYFITIKHFWNTIKKHEQNLKTSEMENIQNNQEE